MEKLGLQTNEQKQLAISAAQTPTQEPQAAESETQFATQEQLQESDGAVARQWVTTDDGNRLFLEGGELKTSPGGKSVATSKTSSPQKTSTQPKQSPSQETNADQPLFNKNPKTSYDVAANIKQQINVEVKPIDGKIHSKGGRKFILVEGKYGKLFDLLGNKFRRLRFVESVETAGADRTAIFLKRSEELQSEVPSA